jgi:nucleoside-diphosphate-sugar epimerase
MKLLIIGGTGNISSEATDLLVSQGHDVTLLNTGRHPTPRGCKLIKADRFNQRAFEGALKKLSVDAVLDFMAFVPAHCRSVYMALRGRLAQYIFISSATVYAKPHTKLPITEETPRGNPFWPYAQDKAACEEYLESVRGDDFPVTIVRPSHTFGRTWIPSPINGSGFTVSARILAGKEFIIHGDGESLWTMTASSDFARGLAGLVGNKAAVGEAFHITSDEALSWNDIYKELGAALGAKKLNAAHIPTSFIIKRYPDARGKLLGDKAENGVFDNSKIKKFVPGFKCEKNFATAIRESVAWFMEKPERREVDLDEDKLIEAMVNAWVWYCQGSHI